MMNEPRDMTTRESDTSVSESSEARETIVYTEEFAL
jgi:hypothetical protein